MDLYVGSVAIDVNDLDVMKSFWERALGYTTAALASHPVV